METVKEGDSKAGWQMVTADSKNDKTKLHSVYMCLPESDKPVQFISNIVCDVIGAGTRKESDGGGMHKEHNKGSHNGGKTNLPDKHC